MENFIVSARKYRPVTFDSVIGQGNVTFTLKNAIKSNHLTHAYLFCGPRGVGKTTCARILAKTINCSNITENVEACDQCESCKAFNESRSFNIHELDAASNNSVDDIRNLIDQVRIPPQVGRYSIYIIDEVHMLSAQAFNAFLKTLEEPPEHAIFILATTEKHKIIPTILSRCQIFDFNRIKVNDIVARLQYVADKENVKVEPDAIHIIGQKADGAMRDALSIFDQIVSFSGNSMSYKNVIENLNVLDYDYYFRLVESFLEGNISGSLLMLDEIMLKGFDPHHLITGLSSHFRDILVCKDKETIQLLEAGASFRERYLNQAQACSVSFIFKSLEILSIADVQFRQSKNQRLLTELALIKIARLSQPEEVIIKKEPVAIKQENKEPSQTVPKSQVSKPAEPVSEKEVPVEKPVVDVPVEEKKPVTQVRESKPAYEPKTTSIKDGLKGAFKSTKNNNEEVVSGRKPDVIQKDVFDLDGLLAKWEEFSNIIKSDRPRLAITLRMQKPVLREDFKVEVEMENANQEEDFTKYIKLDLVTFLKKELKNDMISIETTVSEIIEGSDKPYTQEEKFEFMSEKNPNLKVMKQQLGLDFE
ncbi:MAG: DNA polymerase III subunit gamma/tau [Bacteroidales bacterium]|nr:DNA polymerase III subunit gamma/tau [Bacteroidales bacterium]